MPSPTRPRSEPTEDWHQLSLLAKTPPQRRYELIRPVVLFGRTPAERAQETGVPERSLRRQADRFDAQGVAALLPPSPAQQQRRLPPEVRQAILALKAEHPPLRPHQLMAIVEVRFGYGVGHRTVTRLLTSETLPASVTRRFPPYHQLPDPAARRLAIIHLHAEGWTVSAIADYLQTSRQTVHATLRRWVAEGVAGLADKSHARRTGVRKVDLRAVAAVRELQANPELGAFRIRAALQREGIALSERTCGRILARNRALYGLPSPTTTAREPQPMPFAASWRHHYWTVDLRYLDMHRLGGGQVYVISILENFSRAMLASLLSPRQDLTAYLVVLRAALERHGAPEMLVSDSGAVFLAKQARRIYAALGIEKREIERGQPWQNYIEANFGTMRRMADYHVARATSWAELHAVHERFVHAYNEQAHWAHRDRADGRRSPQAVLGPIHGAWCAPADLDRLFRVRSTRRVDAGGYVRYVHWRLYGERGLAGAQAAVWVLGETVSIEYGTDTLVQYQVGFEPDERHIRQVTEVRLFETRYPSPQPFLPPLVDVAWRAALRLPQTRGRPQRPGAPDGQLPLPEIVATAGQ